MTPDRLLFGEGFLGNRVHEKVLVSIRDGRIESAEIAFEKPTEAEDFDGALILPGFVDLHVHGGDGADFSDGSVEAVRRAERFHGSHGTARLAATLVSLPRDETTRAISSIVEASRSEESIIGAIHLEGPYLARSRCGAHDPESLRLPDPDELEEWLDAAEELPLRMTIAPELPGAHDLVRRYSERVGFQIGHTECDWELALDSVSSGMRVFTHLFNAMPGIHHREPGPVTAAFLSPDTIVELIADGHHVAPSVLHLTAKLTAHRTALVTDAIRAAGRGDGQYRLGGLEVDVSSGVARTSSGALAGSLLTMDEAVRNMVELAGLPIESVIPMATSIPASLMADPARTGSLRAGQPADLVIIDAELRLRRVIRSGVDLT